MVLHSTLTANHVPYNWSYADAATRLSAGGFSSGDVGKLALQQDQNSLWVLTSTAPTWVPVGNQSGLYDLSAGVPRLSAFTLVDPSLLLTNTENPGSGINIKVTGLTPISPNVAGLALAVPSTPYSVAVLTLFNGQPQAYVGISGGWRDSASGKLDLLNYGSYSVGSQCEHQTYNSPSSRAGAVFVGGPYVNLGQPVWMHLADDGTNVSYGISGDGANPFSILSFAKSGGFLTNYNQIFIGMFPDGESSHSATGMSVSILCYDENGLNRVVG